jgi:hypothetical protein
MLKRTILDYSTFSPFQNNLQDQMPTVRRTITKNIRQYSRLGVFEVESGWWDSSKRIYENFLAIMVQQKDITPMADFARTLDQNEKFPGECHLIEII